MRHLSTGGLIVAAAVSASLLSGSADAQETESLFGVDSASVTYGPYARLEFGGAFPSFGDAYWLPPGQSDPRIDFDADGDNTGFGAVAFGFDWQNGLRADVSIFGTGTSQVTAPCSGASDGSSCSTHADISDASVSSRGVMANVYYAPLEARGSNALFQPFVVAGIGVARNEVGQWTRVNPSSGRPERIFEGDTTSDFAWSVGVGASMQITRPGKWPVIVEASWRYYDFGTASGGATPLPSNGNGVPRQPFSFEAREQVVTVGIRVPLQRY